ncbi:MAG: type I 3-dehydroquinate dehydratase [Desulfobulbaceae bacterium]|nr:type I 3-dehydroquinate dehydratase [Desulfobulbaceae bacterium]
MSGTVNKSRICVSIADPSVDGALAAAAAVESLADVIEIRLDSLTQPTVEPFLAKLQKPLLFTCRPDWEGGNYAGDETARVDLLCQAAKSGAAYVDIELRAEESSRRRLLEAVKGTDCQVIASWHDFKVTASAQGLSKVFQEMYRSGAAIGKLVTTARDHRDVLRVLNLQDEAAEMDFPLIAFCMGSAGIISRAATCGLGGYMTYAAPSEGAATAPGQLTVATLRRILTELENAG